MRNRLTVLLALGIAVPALAQVEGEVEDGMGIGHAGTNEIGGSARFIFESADVGGGSASGYLLLLNPAYGRFLTDHFLLRFGLVVGAGGGDLFSGSNFGFQVEPLFVGPAGNLFFYAGGLAGFRIVAPDQGDNWSTVEFGAQGGLLVPLNAWVALDVGMHIEYAITDTDPSQKELIVPIGLIGVRAYF